MNRLSTLCLALVLPAAAWANITPNGTTIAGAGPFTWSYDMQLSRDQDIFAGLIPASNPVEHTNTTFGGFVTIYDFAGYIAGSCTGPVGWTCLVQNLGATPDDVAPIDDPTLPNLTWVYTSGPTLSGIPDGLDLGVFTAQSVYGTVGTVSYAARGTKNIGSQAGTIADNVGNVQGPVALVVPEPASLGLAGLGLALVAVVRRRRAG